MVKYILLFFFTLTFSVAAQETPLADPTQPIDYRVKSVATKKKQRAALPKLQSILLTGEQRKAIMNNKLYTTGQTVNGYKIRRIEKDAVLLRYKNRSYKLTLYTKSERFIE